MGKYSDVETTFIEEVRKFPPLRNTTDTNYKNSIVKENAWRKVTEAVNREAGKAYSGTLKYIALYQFNNPL